MHYTEDKEKSSHQHKNKTFGRYNGYSKSDNVELTSEDLIKRNNLKQSIQNKYFDDRFLIVDSNIFMDISAEWFFDMITSYYQSKGNRLKMYAEQYHEMNNKKNRSSWNSGRRKIATKALQVVEKLIDEDVLEIMDLDSTSDSTAYADGCFFEEIKNNPQNKYCIVSRDLDLRIRIKNKFRDIDCLVLNLKDCDYRNI